MAAFTAFGPMWGFVTAAAEAGRVRMLVFTAAADQTDTPPLPLVSLRANWQRDADGRLVRHWVRVDSDAEPPPL
jgi:hypothetical protein